MKTKLIIFFILINSLAFAKIKIAKSCYDKYPPTINKKTNKKDYLSIFKKNVSEAYTLINHCERRYPEIKRYTDQWKKAAQKITVSCKENHEYYEAHMFAGSPISRFFTAGRSFLYLKSEESKSLLTNHYQVYNQDGNKQVEEIPGSIATLVHEIFHATQANNQKDSAHNEKENHVLSEDCSDKVDLLKDRVYYLEALCTGSHHKFDPIADMAKKIDKCGIQTCEKLFTSNVGIFRKIINMPSKGLKQKDAKKICNRISKTHKCKQIDRDIDYAWKDHRNIAVIKSYLKEDLKKLPSNFVIPLSYINKFPHLKRRVDPHRDSVCFLKSYKIEKGHIKCRNEDEQLEDCDFYDPKINGCDEKSKEKLEDLFWDLRVKYNSVIGPMRSFLEKNSFPDQDAFKNFLEESEINKILGPARVEQYKEIVKNNFPGHDKSHCDSMSDAQLNEFFD